MPIIQQQRASALHCAAPLYYFRASINCLSKQLYFKLIVQGSSQYLVIFNGRYSCPIMIITNHLYFFQIFSYFLILELVLMEFRWHSSLILSIHFILVLHTHTQTRIYTYKEHMYKIIQVP